MSNELKCPFCQQELKPQTMGGEWLECWNCSYSEPNSKHLPQPILCGSRELWQELIRTRKALDVAIDALKKIGFGCGIPPDENYAYNYINIAADAHQQITALEQKE